MEKRLARDCRTVLYDLETDGRDPKHDPIIQIAAVALDRELNVIDEFEVKIRFNPAPDGAALAGLNSYEEDTWNREAVTEREAAKRFSEFVKKHANTKSIPVVIEILDSESA